MYPSSNQLNGALLARGHNWELCKPTDSDFKFKDHTVWPSYNLHLSSLVMPLLLLIIHLLASQVTLSKPEIHSFGCILLLLAFAQLLGKNTRSLTFLFSLNKSSLSSRIPHVNSASDLLVLR